MAWTAASLLLVLMLAWSVIQWGILPNLERWRTPIEQQASKLVGVPVNIGAIRVRSQGLVPTVELDDVVLRDQANREALRLSRVEATLSPRSVFAWTPHFERLSVDGARLDVRRDVRGQLHVAGIPMGQASSTSQERNPARWLFEQNELNIRNASVQWTDEKRQAAPLALSAVEIVVRNAGRQHELQLSATPPASWGQRFTATGKFTHPLLPDLHADKAWASGSDYTTWTGTLHVDLPQADVVQLRQHVNLPFELTSGRGAVKAWFDVSDGRWVSATADVALSDVDVRMASDLEPLDIASLQGRVRVKRTGDAARQGTELAMEGLTFTTKAGQIWPRGDVRLTLLGSPRQPTGGTLQAERIDLAVLSVVATRLPMGPDSRALLAQLQPQGRAERFNASWQGPLDALESWRLAASVQGLVLQANAVPVAAKVEDQTLGRPGIKNGTVDFVATQRGGEGKVSVTEGALTFPGVFEQPRIDFQQIKADVRWTVSPRAAPGASPDIVVSAQGVEFSNADAQGTFEGTWRTGAGDGMGAGNRYPGVLDLKGKLSRGRVAATARYLPLGMAPEVRHYIARAFSAGRVSQATFKVRGDMWAFPFRRQNGEFRFAGVVDGVQMNIAPDAVAAGQRPLWPLFSQLAGEVAFDRTSMKIQNGSGQVDGVELGAVQGEIADFAQPVLTIAGVARGPVAGMLRYVAQSPVGGWIGNALAQTTASGNTELALRLSVPLQQLGGTTVNGTFALNGSDVRIGPDVPLLARARGTVSFTEKSLSIKDAVATVHGGEARFDGGTQSDGALLFNGQGMITAEGFASATELGAVSRLGTVMKGQTPYQLALKFFGAHPEFTVTSTLQGMAVDAPAPLGKAADSSMPLRVSTQLIAARGADKSTAPRDVLRVVAGPSAQAPLLNVHYVRDISGASPKVLAGGIGVGDAAPQPDAGVHAIVKTDALDVDAWQAFGVRLGLFESGAKPRVAAAPAAAASVAPTTTGAAAAAPTVAVTVSPAIDASGYAPSAVAVSANQVVFDARRLTRVTAGLTQRGVDGTWRANLDADQLEGYVQWRPATRTQSSHVQARLSRLSLPAALTDSVEAMLTDDAPVDPPSLDIVIEDFELKGRKLGRVEIDAVHEAAGAGARAWRLNQLRVTTPEAQFKGRGRWSAPDGERKGRRMVLDFNLELLDSGDLLTRFGFDNLIRGGRGVMAGQISWTGSPLTWHAPTLAGNINLKMDAGQFLKVNAGAARLLGVLSLQSLPRRLMLDFRDVFSEGFAFDNITGDVVLAQGQASTNNLRMRGVQAAVLMEGSADVTRETQNLSVWVVPEINAGAASLVYAAINPAVGLGTFLAQLFLRRPLMQATTRQFHIRGSWADPQIDRVDRQPGDRMPDFDTEPIPLAQPTDGAAPAAAAPAAPTPAMAPPTPPTPVPSAASPAPAVSPTP